MKFAPVSATSRNDIVGGSFCSTDGFVDPYSAMIGFMARAGDHGATLWKDTSVMGIAQSGNDALK